MSPRGWSVEHLKALAFLTEIAIAGAKVAPKRSCPRVPGGFARHASPRTRILARDLAQRRPPARERPARLEGVRVSDNRLLGSEGGALPHLEWAIDRGAAAACAEGQGEIQELFDRTVAYLKQRKQFDVPIGSFQALQHRTVDMLAETEVCRSSMILAAIRADSNNEEERQADVSAAKLQLSEGGWLVQENAIQLFGGIGVTDEQDEGLFFKRLRVLQALFGDADWHVNRFQGLRRFDAEVRAER